MKSITCLSGWGQSFNSIEDSFCQEIRQKYLINSLNYSNYSSFSAFSESLNTDIDPHVLVGWSLGGQLALRLIFKKIFNPKILILIAPPFQMIKDERVQAGMSQKTFNEFYNNLKTAPNPTLKKFSILTAMNDKNKSDIVKNLKIENSNQHNLLHWLNELKNFSGFDVELNEMPPTQYIIGLGDTIVHPSQARYFQERIKNIEVNYFENCGHAPHLSNNRRFNEVLLKIL